MENKRFKNFIIGPVYYFPLCFFNTILGQLDIRNVFIYIVYCTHLQLVKLLILISFHKVMEPIPCGTCRIVTNANCGAACLNERLIFFGTDIKLLII